MSSTDAAPEACPGLDWVVVLCGLDELALAPMEVSRDVPGDEWRRTQRAEG